MSAATDITNPAEAQRTLATIFDQHSRTVFFGGAGVASLPWASNFATFGH